MKIKKIGKKLDEYELIIRGDICKRTLCLMGTCLLFYTCLYDMDIIFLQNLHANILIIIISATFFNISMIYKNIYPLNEQRQRVVIFASGLSGLIAVFLSITFFTSNNERVMMEGYVNENLVIMIAGGLLMAIPIFYLIHKIRYKEL